LNHEGHEEREGHHAMDDHIVARPPAALEAILSDTAALGFDMASEPKTGALLKVLAASKPGGRILEIGTGTGVGTSWLLDGMNEDAHLDTVDSDARASAIARRHLGSDSRVTFHLADGAEFVSRSTPERFDLIYADAWPGKFSHLDQALSLLRIGGMYFIDDLLPQTNWPDVHAPKVAALISDLELRGAFVSVKLSWASGLMILVRQERGDPR
jgi:predicted O-methyltransferase YrrM